MRSLRWTLLGAASVVVAAGSAAAQDDTAGWLAMVTTPYGALVPVITPAMLGIAAEAAVFGGDLEFRYGRLDNGATVLNSLGIGVRLGKLGIIGVWQQCDGCSSRSLLGVEYDAAIARVRRDDDPRVTSLYVGLRPAVGVGIVSGEGDAAYAIATTVDLPVSTAIPIGEGVQLIPYAEPGVGNGLVIEGGRRDSRFHGTIALGLAVMDMRRGFGINAGWRQILLHRAAATWGVGVTLRRGGFGRTPSRVAHPGRST